MLQNRHRKNLKVDVGVSAEDLEQSDDHLLAGEELEVGFLEDVAAGWAPTKEGVVT